MKQRQKGIWFFFAVLLGISVVAVMVIKFAQGYRPNFSQKNLRPTGLLVATSIPDGAQLWIDGKLKSATDTTLSLPPGEYKIEIKKDGYFPWVKNLIIKKELVTKTEAYLFAQYPDLKALTFTGASNPLLSPDKQKVVFAVATASANKKGLWVLDLADRPLGLARESRQIIESATGGRDFSQAECSWSPDSKQILVKLANQRFLLEADRLNSTASLLDVTSNLTLIFDRWQKDKETRLQVQLSQLPPKFLEAIQDKAANLEFSPEETKILYTATASASIPTDIVPPLLATSTQKEEREIKPGRAYVYDLKEDKNFFIAEIPTPEKKTQFNLSWFPTSKHIFVVQKQKISLVEYDGTNRLDVYSGPFENSFAFPFAVGNRILILTSISKDTLPNLYAVTLK